MTKTVGRRNISSRCSSASRRYPEAVNSDTDDSLVLQEQREGGREHLLRGVGLLQGVLDHDNGCTTY